MKTKTTHSDLIQLATLLGYEWVEKGLCAGFQGMWMQAVFAQDKQGFENRLHLIAQYKEKLPLLVEKIKQAQQKKTPLTEIEQHFINILAFFDGMALYLYPLNKKDYFGQVTFQSNINSIFSVVKPLSLEKKNCEKIFEKAYIFTKGSLSNFLNETALLLQSQSGSPNPVIHLTNIHHRISLSFDTKNEHWQYVDTNDFARFLSHENYQRNLMTDELVNSIFTSFSASEEATFFTSMWAINDCEQLKNSMNTLALTYPILDLINNSNINLLFWIACKEGQLELVKELLKPKYKYKIDINKDQLNEVTPLSIACQNDHIDIVKELLKPKHQIDINKDQLNGATPLFFACQFGHINIIKELLKHKDRLDMDKALENGQTPLFIACQNGHIDIVKEFLKPKYQIDINKAPLNGATPLYIACKFGHINIVKELLKHKDRLDMDKALENGQTPLFIACQLGDINIVKELLKPEYQIDINKANLNGQTPLYIACQFRHINIIKELLKHKDRLDINKAPLNGVTPLFINCQFGHINIIKELLKHKDQLDMDKALKNGQTPLYIACLLGHTAIVKLLLASPNLKVRDKICLTGHTPLLVACLSPYTKNKKELFQELLKYDINLSHKNDANQTALDIAFANNNQIAIQLILEAAVEKNYSPLQIMSSETLQKALGLFVNGQNDPTEIANLLRSHNALQPNKNTFFVTPHLAQSAASDLPSVTIFKNTL